MTTTYDEVQAISQNYFEAEKAFKSLKKQTCENVLQVIKKVRDEYTYDKLLDKSYVFNRPRKWGYKEELHETDIKKLNESNLTSLVDQDKKLFSYYTHLTVVNFEQLMNFFATVEEEKLKDANVNAEIFKKMFPKDGMFLIAWCCYDSYDGFGKNKVQMSDYLHFYSNIYEYMVVNLKD